MKSGNTYILEIYTYLPYFSFLLWCFYLLKRHRFQIFEKLGVKFNELFLLTEWPQRNLNYFTVNMPLDCFEVFNIFRITVFFFFL